MALLKLRIVKTVKTFGLALNISWTEVCLIDEISSVLLSREGGFTRSGECLPFLGKRRDKANLKQNHLSGILPFK